MIRRVTIEKLAPTGEGVTRGSDGVGFVAGALPGEEVEAEVLEVRKRFWKGRAVSLFSRSPMRVSGPHGEGCAGCDWSHFDLEAARQAKRELFIETMERIGSVGPEVFGPLPIAAAAPAYRLRNRFHVSGWGAGAAVGYFAPRTHRVEAAEKCEALSLPMRELLPKIREAIAAGGAPLSEVATIETIDASRRLARFVLGQGAGRREAGAAASSLAGLFDGLTVENGEGAVLAKEGERRISIEVGGREYPVTARTFFQANRFLVQTLYRDVAAAAGAVPAGRALDLYGGVGLFAGALLDAGHRVVSVEADGASVELSLEAKKRWGAEAWRPVHGSALAFVNDKEEETYEVVVADPPRAGLGRALADALANRVRGTLLYVSCEPPTLARDLSFLLAGGFRIVEARLYDFFAFTHRVEALVTLATIS